MNIKVTYSDVQVNGHQFLKNRFGFPTLFASFVSARLPSCEIPPRKNQLQKPVSGIASLKNDHVSSGEEQPFFQIAGSYRSHKIRSSYQPSGPIFPHGCSLGLDAGDANSWKFCDLLIYLLSS